MSRPLPIDERRIERVMRKIDDHEDTCRRGVTRCTTCADLYREATNVVNIAGSNATPPQDKDA